MGSQEVTGKGYINIENSQMASTGAILTSTNHTKLLNPWPNSSAGHELKIAGCLLVKGRGTIERPSEYLWMSDKLQYQYLPELLVNV